MTKLESGRSMVEMLGVLAIIGVLSIGGILGYNMAMNRYNANNILAAAAQVAITGETGKGGAGMDATQDNIGTTAKALGATVSYTAKTASADAFITISGVAEGVASAINSTISGACDPVATGATTTTCKLQMDAGKLKAKPKA